MAKDNAYLVYRSLRNVHRTMKMGIAHHQQEMVVVRLHFEGLYFSFVLPSDTKAVLTICCKFDTFQ